MSTPILTGNEAFGMVFCGALFGCLLGIFAGLMLSEPNEMKAQAVSRHYAEWKVDPKTGTTTWVWIEPKQEGGK